jgi:hypothetical protein
MSLEAKRKLLQQKLHLRTKELGPTHPATIEVSQNLDKVILEIQKTIN